MRTNTKIIKDLVLIDEEKITGTSTYIDVYYDDKLIAVLTYRNDGIETAEIINISARSLELITALLIDKIDELIKWLEE